MVISILDCDRLDRYELEVFISHLQFTDIDYKALENISCKKYNDDESSSKVRTISTLLIKNRNLIQ